ncbi:Type 1 glutamine amidotransferase-like domain-containing protein [Streptomyces sp. NPDC058701]|uniref:Type 1 glutamine amidotransferase-like domain-containing protein n=1 Tax=Streptomyces sp. NPDC058701 TaxID=3346608 RepID=UPI003653561B
MRLYLSSWRLGEHPEELLNLLDGSGDRTVAVIANAMDAVSAPDRRAAVEREISELTKIGLHPVEVDLRIYFDRPTGLVATALGRFPVVWVRGGNVFVIRHAFQRSGADAALTDLLRRNAVIYAGYSAGACVLAPGLHGLEQCDDPQAVVTAYGQVPRWDGLAVLDYVVVPHVDSPDHSESPVLTRLAAQYRARGVAHRALRDGQAVVVNGDHTIVL